MIELRKTETFARWLDELRDLCARARVQVRIERLAAGNAGDVKAVGESVSEWVIGESSMSRTVTTKYDVAEAPPHSGGEGRLSRSLP